MFFFFNFNVNYIIIIKRDNLSQLLQQQIARAETEQTAHHQAEQKLVSIDKEIMLLKQKHSESIQNYTIEIQNVFLFAIFFFT